MEPRFTHALVLSTLFAAFVILIVLVIPGDQSGPATIGLGFVAGLLGPAIALWPND